MKSFDTFSQQHPFSVTQSIDDHTEIDRLTQQPLPFSVRLVSDALSLTKVIQVRQAAYSRHMPEFAGQLGRAEQVDLASDALVLLAESKLDGEPLGTMRIQTNILGPLALEQSVKLPDTLANQRLTEATRLGLGPRVSGSLVKAILFKAYFLLCVQLDIDAMVITARAPLDRHYEGLLFEDVFACPEFIPMRHVGNVPHRVMKLDVAQAQQRWLAANHRLYGFMCELVHPDLDLTLPASWSPAWTPGTILAKQTPDFAHQPH